MSNKTTFSVAALAIGVAFAPIAAPAQTFTTLYSFKGGTDGAAPLSGVIYSGGLLYGVTLNGGGTDCSGSGCGTIYAVNPTTGTDMVLSGVKGGNDYGNLTLLDGKLFGTVWAHSKEHWGSVFKVNTATGKQDLVYQFKGAPDAAEPFDGLISHGGMLYGTTYYGGTTNVGAVYTVNARSGVNPYSTASREALMVNYRRLD